VIDFTDTVWPGTGLHPPFPLKHLPCTSKSAFTDLNGAMAGPNTCMAILFGDCASATKRREQRRRSLVRSARAMTGATSTTPNKTQATVAAVLAPDWELEVDSHT
jgi:hypothetical protein